MLRFLAYVAVLALIYYCLFQPSPYSNRVEPIHNPPPPEGYAAYNWQQGRPLTAEELKDYVKVSSTVMYHKDSIPEGTHIPKWIRTPKWERDRMKEEYGLTEDDVRDIVNEELD